MAWFLYALGFLAVLTAPVDQPYLAERPLILTALIALVWPLGALGIIIVRIARLLAMARHG